MTDRSEFIYDEAGRPVQMIHNGTVFNYVLNLQGDVQQVLNAQTNAIVATYLCNAWGEVLSATGSMANVNPLRYRGYYFDQALGMYYLNSRFYDPAIGRFINADATWVLGVEQGNLLEFNLFTYCLNNPVNGTDSEGYFKNFIIGAIVGGVVGAVMEVGRQVIFEGARSLADLDVGAIIIEGASGMATGALMSVGLPPNVITAGRASINATTSIVHSVRDGVRDGDSDWVIFRNALRDATAAFVTTYAFNNITRSDQRTSRISSGRPRASPKAPVTGVISNRVVRGGARMSSEALRSILSRGQGPRMIMPSTRSGNSFGGRR